MCAKIENRVNCRSDGRDSRIHNFGSNVLEIPLDSRIFSRKCSNSRFRIFAHTGVIVTNGCPFLRTPNWHFLGDLERWVKLKMGQVMN